MQKIVYENELNIRLDLYLSEVTNKSRSYIKKLVDEHLVFVNGKNQKAGYNLQIGDVIEYEVLVEPEITAKPENIALDIVYEDSDLLVINKPQGMCVHPAVGNYSGTLVNALTFRCQNLSDINGSFRPGIVHRLDKDTAGLLLVAKNNIAHENLAKQISTKECKRHYMAIIHGKLKEQKGQVVTNIARSKRNRQMMEVCDSTRGKLAITNYEVVEELNGYSIVHFELKTGRTHQIRVHAKHLGHPIVGDEVYGFKEKNKGLNGQLLVAYKICFNHPTTNKDMVFEIPLPDYFLSFVKKHRYSL